MSVAFLWILGGEMDPKSVFDYLHDLCRAIDSGRRPQPFGLRRIVVPLAAPAVIGLALGGAGCGAHTSLRDDDAGPADEVCDNGHDDDADGLVDCDDPECASDESCSILPGCEPTLELCEDGIDNNGNGDTDCDDLCCDAFCFNRDCPGCMYGVPFEPADAESNCDDAFDEDCDGMTDCCDPDCAGDPSCSGSGG